MGRSIGSALRVDIPLRYARWEPDAECPVTSQDHKMNALLDYATLSTDYTPMSLGERMRDSYYHLSFI
jgi:hypothetical protein